MQDPLQRIYRLKVTIVAVGSAVLGLALMVFAKYAESSARLAGFRDLPLFELGSTLFITGAFVVAYDYLDGRDKEAREDERIRRLLVESAPAMRDAVVRGFAVQPEDLKRVATPEMLDEIATNALGLRLQDPQFAAELYADIRDQVVHAHERWYDVEVSVRLSSAEERDAAGVPRFDVAVEWEYTVAPSQPVQRFACVSDRDEFRELVSDVPSTLAWYMTPRPGFDASARESFELLQFSVDGEPRPIRRTARKSGQVYSISIGDEVVRADKPVRIRHLYRVITPQSGHRLFFELPQPARGLSLRVDYTDTDISHLTVTDLVSSARGTRVIHAPPELSAKTIDIEVPGWLLPRAGFTCVWTLASEESALPSVQAPTASGPTTPVVPSGRMDPSRHHS